MKNRFRMKNGVGLKIFFQLFDFKHGGNGVRNGVKEWGQTLNCELEHLHTLVL